MAKWRGDPTEQGYPLRLILPGYEGNMHIKWLRRLEVAISRSYARGDVEVHRSAREWEGAPVTFEMEAKSSSLSVGEMKLPGRASTASRPGMVGARPRCNR